MRQKRAKQYRKLLSTYIRTFGLRPPIQILIDSQMANSMASMKLTSEEILIRLESTFQVSSALPAGVRPQSLQQQQQRSSFSNSQQQRKSSTAAAYVKPMITQCSIVELYEKQKDGEVEARAVELAKGWERRYCNHKEPIPGDRCIRSVIGDTNKHRYALAVNSPGLRNAIKHTVAGVPVVHVNDHKVMVMEPMSEMTRKRCEEVEREKLQAISGERQSNVLGKRTSSEITATEGEGEGSGNANQQSQQPFPPRKKKAKGPNPLSMKKSKKDKAKQNENANSTKKAKTNVSSNKSS